MMVRYLRNVLQGQQQHYPGHNPLGALMVVALLIALLVQALTGLFGNDEIVNSGPLYGLVTNDHSLWLTSLHRRLFYWISAAVVVHVLAVLVHYVAKKEKLIKAMWTGRKPAHSVPAAESIQSSRIGLAALLIAVLVLGLAWIVNSVPVVPLSF